MRTPRAWVLGGLLVLVGLTAALFHRQIRRAIAVQLALRSSNPSEALFDRLASQSAQPAHFLERCWGTGRVAQRRLVAEFLKESAQTKPPWFREAEPLVLAGARDADTSVRELALATLEARHDTRLFECAREQLSDVDPLVRLMGLDYLRRCNARQGVPVVIPLLDDPDLRVVTSAEAALTRWSGLDFGVRTRMAIPRGGGAHPGRIDPADAALISQGIQRRKAWWQLHHKDYPAPVPGKARSMTVEPERPPAPDFTLKDLSGKRVSLSDFRGKTVLLNFWATWCTDCIAEMPDLIALRNAEGPGVVILGIALDNPSDGMGPSANTSGHKEAGVDAIRQRVGRAVRIRGINYIVLLDPDGSVGAQYYGGELPTNVILDAQGRVRRRFIGGRTLKVLKAMLAEAAPSR